MEKMVLLIISLWITGIAFSQSGCEKFKTGKFHNVENGSVKSKIERNDSIQIEQHGNIFVKLKIEWMDECSYRLIFIEGNEAWRKSKLGDRSTPDLIVRITDVRENSYLQEAKFADDMEFKYKSTIVKIE
ncbi:hypothetical protein E9993_17390 [Labilibacter sediminis]|nr:hypothetical protein E9993_17390 [Labilibacter sediminis]